jgi:lipid-A-disaccharide synthase
MVVAGEVSGDIHAGNMLANLRQLRPGIRPFGVGGENLAEAGLDRIATSEELAHMGLIEVVRELPRIRGIMNRLVREAAERRPGVAVLVDSPDFNLRLAARLSKLSIPVVLYVSPQLWAWRRGRVRTVKKLAREVLCILPFEVGFYRDHGVGARYVGHPLVDDMMGAEIPSPDEAPANDGSLALLPGSRAMEVRSLLPVMLEALERLHHDEIRRAALIEAPGVSSVVSEILDRHPPDPRLRRIGGADRRAVHGSSAVAWTASGTATLECALLDVPMIVGYRLHPVSALLAKLLVRVPHVALVNLIAEQRAAPELLQREWNPDRLVAATRRLLASDGTRQREALAIVRRRLGSPGASRRAAEAVAEYL